MIDTRKVIRDRGLKATPSRIDILNLFNCECSPLSVEDVLLALKGKKRPDRATVYRILDSFVKAGILKDVHFNDGVVRFEKALGHSHHHHAVCTTCGTTCEVEDSGMEKAIEKVSKKIKGFSLNEHSLEFFGTCDKCGCIK